MSSDKKYVVDLDIISDWDWIKNEELGYSPNQISHGSTKSVFWICPKGHSYKARVDHRTIMGSSCPFCKGKLPIVGENDLATLYPHLLTEWDYEYNAQKLPSDYLCSSNKKVGWVCASCSNKWKASIAHRTGRETGCPKCARIHRGETRTIAAAKKNGSLAEKYEYLLDEWDYKKNSKLIPTEVSAKSNKKVWWLCKEFGHSYETPICNRVIGQGCPVCANKTLLKGYNDLATKFPLLASEWHPTLNGELHPEDVFPGSEQYAWWKCSVCTHEWRSNIYSRTGMNTGCPVCAGRVVKFGFNDLSTVRPELLEEWDFNKNIEVKPESVTLGSNKKAWWLCKNNHSFQMQISARSQGRGCPECAKKSRPINRQITIVSKVGNLLETHPDIVEEWDYSKNKNVQLEMLTAGSDKKAWWICRKGHSWNTSIYHKVKGIGCPVCNGERFTSFPEQTIFFYLSKVTEAQHRHRIDGYEIDIYLPEYKIGIEYNGRFYHQNRKHHDEKKKRYFESIGIYLICVEEDYYNSVDGNTIHYKYKNAQYDDFEYVINNIFEILKFSQIDVNVSRDRNKIYEQYIILEKENSVGYMFPDLLEQWNYEKNGKLSPFQVSHGSDKKVWWKCPKCTCEWQATISSRKKSGCPCCSGRIYSGINDLSTLKPDVLKYWDYNKNVIVPSKIGLKSKEKVWWKCDNNHFWSCSVNTQVKRGKCPHC